MYLPRSDQVLYATVSSTNWNEHDLIIIFLLIYVVQLFSDVIGLNVFYHVQHMMQSAVSRLVS